MTEWMTQPWPWYLAGPAIGLILPLLLYSVGETLSISSSFRDLCAAALPGRLEYLSYDWRANLWRMAFVLGVLLGGFVAWELLASSDGRVAISAATAADLTALGITDLSGLVPRELVSWGALGTVAGWIIVVGGGFLVGFGTRYADGCTSGHAISGLAGLQLPSLVAVLGFFVGGLVATHLILPLLLGGFG